MKAAIAMQSPLANADARNRDDGTRKRYLAAMLMRPRRPIAARFVINVSAHGRILK